MAKQYVISDLHLGHTNIIEYCQRPFDSIKEMDEEIIRRWNSVVQDEDDVFVVGDYCLRGKEEMQKYTSRLKGRKILIKGNHDHQTNRAYLDAGFYKVVKEELLVQFDFCDEPILFSHHPKYDDDKYLNLYGHVHNNPANDSRHICVCAEVLDYTPVLISSLLK